MKFVFALALVAICVMLMHAKPNVKRSEDNALFRVDKRGGQHKGAARNLDKILKGADGGRKHGSGNGNTETDETIAEKETEVGEEAVEKTIQNDNFKVDKRGATNTNTIHLWKDGNVPYKYVDAEYGKQERNGVALETLVNRAAEIWNQKAGLNIYLDQDAETDVIEIKNGKGCWSWIGYQGSGNKNEIALQNNACFDIGVILHEMGHAIGFMHEAQRKDRNYYIKVHDENIDPEYKLQFTESDNALPVESKSPFFDNILNKYDYCSIMHYSQKAFSMNKKSTITMDDKPLLPCLGGHYDLSLLDGEVMSFLYGNLGTQAEQAKCKNKGYRLKSSTKCVCGELFEGDNCETPITDDCGTPVHKLTKVGEEASFMTPKYSATTNQPYPMNYKCEWQFNAPDKTKLCLGFPDGFDVEEPDTNSRCSFDWFQLIDELYFPDTERYCGHETSFSKLSEGTDFVVRFNSDDMYALQGFQGVAIVVNDKATEATCKEAISSRSSGSQSSQSGSSSEYSSYSEYSEYS